MTNYSRKLRIKVDFRKKRKVEKTTEFAKKIKNVQKEAGTVLRKA